MNLETQLGRFGKLVRSVMPARLKPRRHLMRRVEALTSKTICGGPFKGMRYIDQSYYSAYYPKLMGTYEREIVTCVEDLISFRPDLVIDIGAAEGYYAVGLARRMPTSKIVAFEMDGSSRDLLRSLTSINEVSDRVDVRGTCDVQALRDLFRAAHPSAPAMVCDVEGFESVLLDPSLVLELRSAYILVEVHDVFVAGCGQLLEARFHSTHEIIRIEESPRSSIEFPYHDLYSRLMPRRYIEWLLWEGRPAGGGIYWLWMRPKR